MVNWNHVYIVPLTTFFLYLKLREKLIFLFFFISAILCLGLSSLFHTVCCHSEWVNNIFRNHTNTHLYSDKYTLIFRQTHTYIQTNTHLYSDKHTHILIKTHLYSDKHIHILINTQSHSDEHILIFRKFTLITRLLVVVG